MQKSLSVVVAKAKNGLGDVGFRPETCQAQFYLGRACTTEARASCELERLLQIGDEIPRILDADRYPNEPIGDACNLELLCTQ